MLRSPIAKAITSAASKPEDFVITEDKIQERVATFEEGNESARRMVLSGAEGKMVSQMVAPESGDSPSGSLTPGITGANVFILFDTSNYMYRGFVFAQDAIADFIRSLEGVSRVAFYSYSRDLSRAVPLTGDRSTILRGVRSTVAGDDAALYNCLLMTVKGRRAAYGPKGNRCLLQWT